MKKEGIPQGHQSKAWWRRQRPTEVKGKTPIRVQDSVLSNPAIRHLTVPTAEARPQDTQKHPHGTQQLSRPHKGPGTQHRSQGGFSSQISEKCFPLEREGLHIPGPLLLVLDLSTFCLGRQTGSRGSETRTRYLQWCPTWSSFQEFFFH